MASRGRHEQIEQGALPARWDREDATDELVAGAVGNRAGADQGAGARLAAERPLPHVDLVPGAQVPHHQALPRSDLAHLVDGPPTDGERRDPGGERERLYDAFRTGGERPLVVSKVANFSIDLPDAAVALQVSGTFGSRQEEAQRLGRILRPKAEGGCLRPSIPVHLSGTATCTGGDSVPAKSDRIEARLSPDEREQIHRAAEFEGQSVSSFMVTAAVEKADQIISEHILTRVPADYFDQLLRALDEPGPAPQLQRAARRARLHSRIR